MTVHVANSILVHILSPYRDSLVAAIKHLLDLKACVSPLRTRGESSQIAKKTLTEIPGRGTIMWKSLLEALESREITEKEKLSDSKCASALLSSSAVKQA